MRIASAGVRVRGSSSCTHGTCVGVLQSFAQCFRRLLSGFAAATRAPRTRPRRAPGLPRSHQRGRRTTMEPPQLLVQRAALAELLVKQARASGGAARVEEGLDGSDVA